MGFSSALAAFLAVADTEKDRLSTESVPLDTIPEDRDSVERCDWRMGVLVPVDLNVVVGPAVEESVLMRTAGLRTPSAMGRDSASNGRANIVCRLCECVCVVEWCVV